MPPLAHTLVVADGARPDRTLLFLHGIIGRGSNLRTVARKVVAARPGWAVALCDLRMHGASQGFAPPHTVAAAAADLDGLDAVMPAPIRGVLGHSFGGKVALSYLARRPEALDEVVVVDASPAARPLTGHRGSTLAVLDFLSSLPPRLPSRAALVDAAVSTGITRSLGEWLAMNLVPASADEGGGYRLALELPALHAMLADYLALDLWEVVERVPGHARLDVVIAERGGVFPPEDRERLARAAAAQPGRLGLHALDTGHWVHADDPDGLAAVVIGVV